MVKGVKGDPLVALAKEAVEEYVLYGRRTPAPTPVPAELVVRAGAFVCLKNRGRLRGCIGTIEPMHPTLADEIINNAISAAVNDPRFEPVTTEELDGLEYTVDVLSHREPVDNLAVLDPRKFGVIVETEYKRGLLLPDLEGIDTVEDQLGIAMQKAGILPGEPMSVFRFQVTRHA